jgi:hypothetical protein
VRRLAAEGVLVQAGRIDLERYGWERDLDGLLWGPDAFVATVRAKSGRRAG